MATEIRETLLRFGLDELRGSEPGKKQRCNYGILAARLLRLLNVLLCCCAGLLLPTGSSDAKPVPCEHGLA